MGVPVDCDWPSVHQWTAPSLPKRIFGFIRSKYPPLRPERSEIPEVCVAVPYTSAVSPGTRGCTSELSVISVSVVSGPQRTESGCPDWGSWPPHLPSLMQLWGKALRPCRLRETC